MRHIPAWICDFDIDIYLNHAVPPSPLSHLPYPIAYWLGYRRGPKTHVCQPAIWFWSFIGAFCGVALIEGVYRSSSVLKSWNPPIVIGSFGAAAILEYNTIESPLAQPRNLVLSHLFAGVIGVGFTKLFALLPPERFDDLRWLAGALAVGASSSVMSITKTVHPPAGATALLAATTPDISALGWKLIPLVLIGSLLMLGSAMLINNIQRVFPTYWWTAQDVRKEQQKEGGDGDIEKTPTPLETDRQDIFVMSREIKICRDKIMVPEWLEINPWEKQVLEILRNRLQEDSVSSVEDQSAKSGRDDEGSELSGN